MQFSSQPIHIVWKDYSVFIFSKVVSCSWRCECHRPKTAIIKWTCPLILTSSPISDWGFFWTHVLVEKGPENRVCLSFHPSFCLSVTFLRIGSFFFLKISMLLGIYSYMWQSRIFWKKFPCSKNDQNWSKMVQKQVFWSF